MSRFRRLAMIETPRRKALPPTRQTPKAAAPAVPVARRMAIVRSQSKHLGGLPPGKAAVITAGGIRYVDRGDAQPEPAQPAEVVTKPKPAKPRQPAAKNDPKHVAAARELRDRYLEQFNGGRCLPEDGGKYDVGRLPGPAAAGEVVEVRELGQRRAVLALPAA